MRVPPPTRHRSLYPQKVAPKRKTASLHCLLSPDNIGQMQFPRLSRFKRASAVARMQLTERDHEIIRLVHRYRFLRSSHILALIGDSPQQLLRRLKLLYHHGYLERPRAQIDYYHQGGSHHMVYGLGDKGAALLKHELGPTSRELSWNKKNRSIGRIFLEHALFVSDVMVSIELACRRTGIRLLTEQDLQFPDHRGRPFRWTVNVSNRMKLGVIPDRVFAVDLKRQGGKSDRAFFFLEADRATTPVMRKNLSQSSFYRKLLAYEATWSQSIHRARLGFNRFRVLTVTTSAERIRSLVEACSTLKHGQGLFLFADRGILKDPSDVFSRVWQTARNGERVGLLD
jgi:protein involved in plasmid replication-relaxation